MSSNAARCPPCAAISLLCGFVLGAWSGPALGNPLSGPARVLLMVVDGNTPVPRSLRHFENNQVTNTTWSDVSTLHHFAFERSTSFASLYDEMSFGGITLSGDTLLMAIPFDAADLTWTEWAALADAEAQSRGYDLSTYDRFLYVLPHLPKGAYTSGSAAGDQGWCAFASQIELGCLFHEFGHTIGFTHAAELQPNGTATGLGDVSDGLMGSGFNSHVNVVNKLLAGWLTGSRLQTFDTTGSASFTLAPLSSGSDTLQALEIVNKGARPILGVVDTFVSFRDTAGFDAQLLSSGPDRNGDDVTNAVLVHQWFRLQGGNTTYLQALVAGETYDEHGVTVTVDALGAADATVTVTRAPYFPAAPLVSVTPSDVEAEPAETAFYFVSITNTNDPASVSFDSLYDVTFGGLDPDWLVGPTSTLPTSVPPGQTQGFFYFVQSPSGAAAGPHGFTVTATDHDGDAGPVSGDATVTYTVVLPEVDTDLDGILDGSDNCTLVANPGQADADLDGCGDVCDTICDPNANGVVDITDITGAAGRFGCPDPENPLCPGDGLSLTFDCNNDGTVDISDVTGLAGSFNAANGPSGLDPSLRISGVPADGGNGLNCP